MSRPVVNLARRAFVNSRPVRRATVLLWVLGALVLGADVWLYRSYFVGSSEKARRLAEVEEAIAGEHQRIAALEARLSGMNLAQQNQTVEFLNRKIGERSFAWSQLFDDLTEVLPQDVRLERLDPEGAGDRRRQGLAGGAAADGGPPAVTLVITGEARNDEALLALLDALFDHPAFHDPNPQREARSEGSMLRFDLTVGYLPGERREKPDDVSLPDAPGGETPAAEATDDAPAQVGQAGGPPSPGETT